MLRMERTTHMLLVIERCTYIQCTDQGLLAWWVSACIYLACPLVQVAVKEVLGESDAQGLRELRQEAALLRALHHSRIATCLGVVTRPLTHTRTTSPHAHAHGGGDHGSAGAGHAGGMLGVSLVMEYYPFSLHATMRSRERAARLLRPDVRARIAREIAEVGEGMCVWGGGVKAV